MKIIQIAVPAILLFMNSGVAANSDHHGRIDIVLPEGTKIFYVNLTDSAGLSVSTQLVTLGVPPAGQCVAAKRIHYDSTVWQVPQIFDNVPDSLRVSNLKAFYFAGLDHRGKKTRVFAYLGFPANASAYNKVPGVVLVHGAIGTAFPQWAKIWNERGYAAITMDLEGRLPPLTHHDMGGPSNTLFADSAEGLSDQWLYHAVGDVYLAYSLLVSDERVDRARVGITGISWGGIITAIAIGNSDCFAFAVPVYGCGYLHGSKAMYRDLFTSRAARQWDPSNWLGTVTTLTLWINSDSDRIFSIDATTKSSQATKNSSIAILPHFPHSHVDGWAPPEIYAFANSMVKGEKRFIKITKKPTRDSPAVEFDAAGSRGFKSATLIYSLDTLSYDADYNPTSVWLQLPLKPSKSSVR